jgi:hypothetical protein
MVLPPTIIFTKLNSLMNNIKTNKIETMEDFDDLGKI